jgi:NAD(P)-dependent dehydrogenase (short-subunit alcohol dehydrogenase family)
MNARQSKWPRHTISQSTSIIHQRKTREMSTDLAIRNIIVTGASAGIGAAIARVLGHRGHRVAIGARRLSRLNEVADAVSEAGGTPFAGELDVTSPESIDAFWSASEEAIGPIDAVVNNAGICAPGLLHEVEPEDMRREITTNLLGPMWMSRRAIPSMVERGHGDLIFIGSDNSDNPRPYQAGYSASKAGILNLTRVLAMELEGTGVRVTNLRLGPTASEFGAGWEPEKLTRMLEYWKHFSLLRNQNFIDPEVVGETILHALEAPRAATLANIELQPTPPRVRLSGRDD